MCIQNNEKEKHIEKINRPKQLLTSPTFYPNFPFNKETSIKFQIKDLNAHRLSYKILKQILIQIMAKDEFILKFFPITDKLIKKYSLSLLLLEFENFFYHHSTHYFLNTLDL